MTEDSTCSLCGKVVEFGTHICEPVKEITCCGFDGPDPKDYINHEGMWTISGWTDENPITAEFLRVLGWTDITEEYFGQLDDGPDGLVDLHYVYEWVSDYDYGPPQSWFLLKVFWEANGKGPGPWFEFWDGDAKTRARYYTGGIVSHKSFLEHMIANGQNQSREVFAGTRPVATNEEAFEAMRDIQQSSIENLSFSDLHQVLETVNGKVSLALAPFRHGIIMTEEDRAQAEDDRNTYLFMHRRLQAEISKRLGKLLEHEKEELEGQTAILSVEHGQEDQSGLGPEEDSASSTQD